MKTYTIFLLVFLANCAFARDFYMGMFRKNDFLVGSDTLYKQKYPFQHQIVKYGRLFKCPITYFRVSDRLGVGPGPRVQIIRGGLRHKYIVAKITGGYNLPIAVNVYVGCNNNKKKTTKGKPTTTTRPTHEPTHEPTHGPTHEPTTDITPSINDTEITTDNNATETTEDATTLTDDNTENTGNTEETTEDISSSDLSSSSLDSSSSDITEDSTDLTETTAE